MYTHFRQSLANERPPKISSCVSAPVKRFSYVDDDDDDDDDHDDSLDGILGFSLRAIEYYFLPRRSREDFVFMPAAFYYVSSH